MKKYFTIALMLVVICLPVLALAQDPGVANTGKIVPCDTNCKFADLFKLFSNFVDFILRYLAGPVAAIMFVYAGILYTTDGGSGKKVGQAKTIFTNTIIGLFFILVSYLIVKAVVLGLAGSETSTGRGLINFFNR